MVNGYNPLMLGSKRSSDTGLNISFDTGYKSPSVCAQIGQFGLGLASVFLNAAICRAADPTTRGGGGGSSTTKAPAEEQTQLTPTDLAKVKLGELEAAELAKSESLKMMENEIKQLTKATNPDDIKAKEGVVNDLKNKLYEANGAYKENVKKVVECENKITTTQNILTEKNNCVSSLDADIVKLTNLKAGADALASDPEKGDAAKARSAELDAQIKQKTQEKTSAQKDAEKAKEAYDKAVGEKVTLQNSLGEEYSQIITTREDYEKQNAELTSLKNGLKTNETRLKQLTETELPKLKSDINELKGQIKALKDQLLDIEGQQALDKNKTAKDYTTADQNDGNWWKRNMPKWLGGAGKTERGLMKDQHKLKKAAGERLEAMGVDTDNYTVKGVQKAEAKAKAEQKTKKFLDTSDENKSKYTRYQIQITAYYMKHPDAKNDDIRKFLNIK